MCSHHLTSGATVALKAALIFLILEALCDGKTKHNNEDGKLRFPGGGSDSRECGSGRMLLVFQEPQFHCLFLANHVAQTSMINLISQEIE